MKFWSGLVVAASIMLASPFAALAQDKTCYSFASLKAMNEDNPGYHFVKMTQAQSMAFIQHFNENANQEVPITFSAYIVSRPNMKHDNGSIGVLLFDADNCYAGLVVVDNAAALAQLMQGRKA